MSKEKQNIKNKGGRPSKWKEEFIDKVYKLSLLGATDIEMADILNVSKSIFNKWKETKEGFLDSIKKGKTEADANVSERLYKRAIGYKYTEKRTEKYAQGTTKTTVTEKILAPDPTAQIFWLKNRQPKKWRDSKSIDHTTGGEKLLEDRKDREKRIKELIQKHQNSADG